MLIVPHQKNGYPTLSKELKIGKWLLKQQALKMQLLLKTRQQLKKTLIGVLKMFVTRLLDIWLRPYQMPMALMSVIRDQVKF